MKTKYKKKRLDIFLFKSGLTTSRNKSTNVILAGLVLVNKKVTKKTGYMVLEKDIVEIQKRPSYVSRGGNKLEGALKFFSLYPKKWVCLDIGASTGGFTDCLLQKGALRIVTIDVGYGQLDWKLRNHKRVKCIERLNIRYLNNKVAKGPFDIMVIDVSFISLTLIISSNLIFRLKKDSFLLAMIKPQFEIGKKQINSGGVIRNLELQKETIKKVVRHLIKLNFKILGICFSCIRGIKGNQEYFVLAKRF